LACWLAVFGLVFQATDIRGSETNTSASPPFPTGSHLQLVRTFFTTANGLPTDEIRAVTATRDGLAIAATAKALARLEGERWVNQTGPAEVTALFAPARGPSALAGASNGVWALTQAHWQLEQGSPANV